MTSTGVKLSNMTATFVQTSAGIERRQGAGGVKTVLRGTSIRVAQIVWEYWIKRWSIERIVQAHPDVSPQQVCLALAHFYQHPEEILEELGHELQSVEQFFSSDKTAAARAALPVLLLKGLRFESPTRQPRRIEDEPGVYLVLQTTRSRHAPYRIVAVGESERPREQVIERSSDCWQAHAPLVYTLRRERDAHERVRLVQLIQRLVQPLCP